METIVGGKSETGESSIGYGEHIYRLVYDHCSLVKRVHTPVFRSFLVPRDDI